MYVGMCLYMKGGRMDIWCEGEETYRALGEVTELSGGNTGEGDEEGGNEGLHGES